jgi:hypothetical protein
LFDTGGDARANGIPFDVGRTQPWRSKHLDAQKLAELQAKLETARDAEEEAK